MLDFLQCGFVFSTLLKVIGHLMMINLSFFLSIWKEIRKVGKDLGIVPTIFQNEELKEKGFGGQSKQ